MSKHTPGPWEWWTSCSFKRLTHKQDGDVLSGYVCSDGIADISVSKADANLIAAAPDYYSATDKLLQFFVFVDSHLPPETGSGFRQAWRELQAAHDKASGES